MIANPNISAYRYRLDWADQLGRGWSPLPLRPSVSPKLPHRRTT